MDKQQVLKILQKAQSLEKHKEVAFAKEFIAIEDKIEKQKEELLEIKVLVSGKFDSLQDDLKKKLEEELSYEVDEQEIVNSVLSKVKIPKPIKGEKGDNYKLTPSDKIEIAKSIIVPIVEKTEVIRETPIITENIKEVALHETGEEIATKLESLKNDARLDFSALKNVPEMKEGKANGGGWHNLFQLHDVTLSSPTNDQVLKYNSTTSQWENGTGGGSVGPGTINEIAYFDTENSIASLPVATYPSLTELTYVKGVTSAIQTQLNGRVPYTGATANVDLGAFRLTSNEIYSQALTSLNIVAGDNMSLQAADSINLDGTNSVLLRGGSTVGISNNGGSAIAYLDTTILMTADRTFTFPDYDGTLALTSDITGINSGTNTGDQTNIPGNAETVTTNANLTGIVTSLGNATSIADAALSIAKISGLMAALDAKFTLPSLTAGSVLFSNGSTIEQDNANLFWDDTNNRLGIGIAAPTQALHVVGKMFSQASVDASFIASSSGAQQSVALVAGASKSSFLFANNGAFSIQTNTKANVDTGTPSGTSLFEMNASGEVSIGATPVAAYKLDVISSVTTDTAASRTIIRGRNTGSFATGGQAKTNYIAEFINTATRASGANALTNVALRASASGAQFNYAGLFSGLVGLDGVTVPTAKLHIGAGSATANTAPIKLTSGTLNTTPEAGAIEFDGTNLYFVNSAGVRRTISFT